MYESDAFSASSLAATGALATVGLSTILLAIIGAVLLATLTVRYAPRAATVLRGARAPRALRAAEETR